MRHRLTGAILLLYPRRVREGHGPEIVALIDDLIADEGRSRTGLFIRLAADGLVQRIASTATAWTVVAALAATSFGGLAVSDFAAANATHQVVPRTVHTTRSIRRAGSGIYRARDVGESAAGPRGRRARGRHVWAAISRGDRSRRPGTVLCISRSVPCAGDRAAVGVSQRKRSDRRTQP